MHRRSAVSMDKNAKVFDKADNHNNCRTGESQEEERFKRMHAECKQTVHACSLGCRRIRGTVRFHKGFIKPVINRLSFDVPS